MKFGHIARHQTIVAAAVFGMFAAASSRRPVTVLAVRVLGRVEVVEHLHARRGEHLHPHPRQRGIGAQFLDPVVVQIIEQIKVCRRRCAGD